MNKILFILLLAPALSAGAAPTRTFSAPWRPLSGLKTAGFAIVPAAPLLPADAVAALRAGLLAPEARAGAVAPYGRGPLARPGAADINARRTWVWYAPRLLGRGEDSPGLLPPALAEPARAVIAGVTAALRLSLPDEDLHLAGGTELRLADGVPSAGARVHGDGAGYLAATVALNGTGTTVYELLGDDAVSVQPSPEGSLVVITNPARQFRTAAPSTVHSAPLLGQEARLALILRYHSPSSGEDRRAFIESGYTDIRAENEERVRRIKRLLTP